MKNALPLFLFLFFCSITFSQNNVISNSGFELKDWGVNDNEPDQIAHLRKADTWEEDQNCSLLFPHACDHSPDWFKTGSNHVNLYTINADGNHIPIPAHGGTGYVGFFCGELFEQKLGIELEFGKKYTVSMFIRLLNIDFGDLFLNWPNNEDMSWPTTPFGVNTGYIDILLGKDKIKYNSDDADLCSEDWYEKENPFITTVASTISFSGDNWPSNQWVEFTTSFIVLDDNFDWIGFEFRPSASGNDNYLLADDITLVKDNTPCEECQGCDPTDGCVTAYTNNVHKYIYDDCNGEYTTNPLTIYNLDNVSFVSWEITAVGGQHVRTIEVHNPGSFLSWDGNNDSGFEVADGLYSHTCIIANSCGAKRIISSFAKAVNVTQCGGSPIPHETPDDLPGMNYSPVVKIDYNDACCNECIILDASTGFPTLSGDVSYTAINKILIGPNVFIEPNTILNLQAGELIHFIGGDNSITIKSKDNAIQTFKIEDCVPPFSPNSDPPSFAISPPQLNEQTAVSEVVKIYVDKKSEAQVQSKTEVEFSISSNPNSGEFEIRCSTITENQGKIVVTVQDSHGRIVFEKSFHSGFDVFNVDISGNPDGVYFVSMSGNNINYHEKIVKSSSSKI